MIGLFLAATAMGLLFFAADKIGGALQKRLADAPEVRTPRERVFSVNVVQARAGTETAALESFGAGSK